MKLAAVGLACFAAGWCLATARGGLAALAFGPILERKKWKRS